MTQLTRFPIDQSFKDRLKTHGFCIDDPDKRFPTRNDFPSRVLDLRGRTGKNKAALLLSDRNGRNGADRSRILPWLAPLIGWAGWPEQAKAHDHHPPILQWPAASPAEGVDLATRALDWLGQIRFDDPALSSAMLGALLMTQTVAMMQRRALLKATVASAPPAQADLFPETLPNPARSGQATTWAVDAATRQGQVREENQDALRVLRFADDVAVMIVCDGAGGIGGGREASQSAVAAISDALTARWNDTATLSPADLNMAIEAARKAARDKDLEGVTTALLVLLDGENMHFATLGDGAVSVIWPDGMVGPVQVPHHTLGRPANEIGAYIGGNCAVSPRSGSLRLEPGCFVLVLTDGASDLFGFEDFARERHNYRTVKDLADHFLTHLEAARDLDTGAWLHSDNMTLAIAHLEVEVGNDHSH